MNTSKDNYLNNNKFFKNLIEYQDYYLIKESNVYKIIIGRKKSDIIFKCKKYELKLNNNDLSKITKSKYNTIDDAYKFIINIFEQNKIVINEIIVNKLIKLKLKINIDKDIEIILLYNKENKDVFINELNNNYNELKTEINNLKNDFKLLKNELDKLKNNNDMNNNIKNKNKDTKPKDIHFLNDLVKDSFAKFCLDNTFSVFKSINNLFYLIYTNKNKSIISFDIMDNKKVIEIKNAHEQYITNFRHYCDKINKRDLLITISGEDNNIKLWNINSFDCLLDIKNINKNGFLDSACFLTDNNKNYIISSNVNYTTCEAIKVFDFKGNKIKEIANSNDTTIFIDSYYDKKTSKNYIITGNYGYAKSYDFNKNKLYHKYSDNNNKSHDSIIINATDEIIKLIGSSEDGYIRIWNFNTGFLLNKIKISKNNLYGICLWNNDYLIIGERDKAIKILELKSEKIIKSLSGYNNFVLTIKKIDIPKYGECFISQGLKNEPIKIWNNKITS